MPTCQLYSANGPVPPPRAAPASRPVEAPIAAPPAPEPPEPPEPPAPEPPAFAPSATVDEHVARADAWCVAQAKFHTQDARAIHHREQLDERAATLRMRFEGLHHELIEMTTEYNALQRQDDAREADRWAEHAALCADADAWAEPRPSAPRSVALHYDASSALRGVDGKLKHKLHLQRGDRAPDWLGALTAVAGTAVTAWAELVHDAELPDDDAPWRPAVNAVKAVGRTAREAWQPQYNLCAHADGVVETPEDNVVGGAIAFSYTDKYGEAWRAHLARHSTSADARAPLTGPRVNGRLAFATTLPLDLPHAYTDQHREIALDAVATGRVGEEALAAHLATHGAAYSRAIRLHWMRERSDAPLHAARLREMVATRARRELAKAWREPDSDGGFETAGEEEGVVEAAAAMEESTVEAEAPSSPVSHVTTDLYNLTSQFEKPWYAR